MHKRKCLNCHAEFEAANGKRMCCDWRCSAEYQVKKQRIKKYGTDVLPGHEKRNCTICGKEFEPVTRRSMCCSRDCSTQWQILKSQRKRGYFAILERDAFTCIYCGRSSIEDKAWLHLDHIRPRSKGGEDIAMNLVTACSNCNMAKHNNELREPSLCRIQAVVIARNIEFKINDKSPVEMSSGYQLRSEL